MLLSIIRALRNFKAFQRNLHELARLSDRELSDIGIGRGDIYNVAAGNYRARTGALPPI